MTVDAATYTALAIKLAEVSDRTAYLLSLVERMIPDESQRPAAVQKLIDGEIEKQRVTAERDRESAQRRADNEAQRFAY